MTDEIEAKQTPKENPSAPIESKSKKESPEEMFKLAQILHKGDKDTAADIPRAVALYQSALEEGFVEARGPLLEILAATPAAPAEEKAAAMEMMGIEEGEGEAEADEAGAKLVEEAAELEESNPKKSIELYTTAVNEYDDPDAMNALAILLEGGVGDDVKADPKRALELYSTAADQHNHAEAMFNLGVLLVKGAEGVAKNAARAVKLYEKAIEEAADTDAMKNLAVLLQEGADGVPVDKERALYLYNEAKNMEVSPMEDEDEDDN